MTRSADIGSLRHRIRIEHPLDVPDGAGGFSRSWETTCQCWAFASQIAAAEQGADQQVQHLDRMRFVLRWRDGIDATMRVVHDGRAFDIESVADPEQNKRYLIIESREMRP